VIPFLGIAYGLTSAVVWGTGDFLGGLAARRSAPFQVLTLAAMSSLVVLLPLVGLTGEAFPSAATIGWSFAAGLSGAVGIVALYRGLSLGSAAVVAPTSAIVSAAVPVLVGTLVEGLPAPTDLAGIAAGLVGIALVSRPPGARSGADRRGFGLGLAAGVGFGAFFVLFAQVERGGLFAPLAVAKLAALIIGGAALLAGRQVLPHPRSNPIALIAGVLDAGGNLFFLLASRATTLAIASVLSAMYPASTVALSAVVLKESIGRIPFVGVVLCLAGVALISM